MYLVDGWKVLKHFIIQRRVSTFKEAFHLILVCLTLPSIFIDQIEKQMMQLLNANAFRFVAMLTTIHVIINNLKGGGNTKLIINKLALSIKWITSNKRLLFGSQLRSNLLNTLFDIIQHLWSLFAKVQFSRFHSFVFIG